MKKMSCARAIALGGIFLGSLTSASAATLDDVMARLDAIQRENTAMRKEIAALRAQRQAAPAPEARNTRTRRATAATDAAPRDANAAFAAAPRYPASGPYDWSGFHAGFHAGYANGSAQWSPPIASNGFTPFDSGTEQSVSGWLGGVQAGLDYQIGRIVLGAGASLSYAGVTADTTFLPVSFAPIYTETARPADRLDLSVNYAVLPNLTIFGDWTNITRAHFHQDFSSARAGAPRADYLRYIRFDETTVSLGIRFNFGG